MKKAIGKEISATEKLELLKKAVVSLRDVLQFDDRFEIEVKESAKGIDLQVRVKEK